MRVENPSPFKPKIFAVMETCRENQLVLPVKFEGRVAAAHAGSGKSRYAYEATECLYIRRVGYLEKLFFFFGKSVAQAASAYAKPRCALGSMAELILVTQSAIP